MTESESEAVGAGREYEALQSDLPPPPMSLPHWVERVSSMAHGWLPVEARPRLLRAIAEGLVDARVDLGAEASKLLGVAPGEFILHELTPLVAGLHACALRLGAERSVTHHSAPTTVIAAPPAAMVALPMLAAFRAFARGAAVALVAEAPVAGLLAQVAEVARKAGLPHGGVTVTTGELSAGLALSLSDVAVQRALWLGAPRHARAFQVECLAGGIEAQSLPYGAGTAVVYDNADLDLAARAIVASRVTLGGLRHDAIQRVVVSASVHDALALRIARQCAAVVSDPWVREALERIDPVRRDTLRARLGEALAHGAAVVSGEAPPALGLVAPVVLTDEGLYPGLAAERVGAPLLALLRVAHPEQHAATVLSTHPGSVLSVFGGDNAQHRALAARAGVPLVLVDDAVTPGLALLDLPRATAVEGAGLTLAAAPPDEGAEHWAPYSVWTRQTASLQLLVRHGRHGFGGPLGDLY